MTSDKIRLGINIDHIATIRNARGGSNPDPTRAINIIASAGADLVTFHLREDRRHINDEDVYKIKNYSSLPLNFEMALTQEMKKIALRINPYVICLVPEKREEITTEGGLDVVKNFQEIKNFISDFKKTNIKISIFIDPNIDQIKAAKDLDVDMIEIHTGRFANLFEKNEDFSQELEKIHAASEFTVNNGLICNAGHGLNYENVEHIAKIKYISELNIGHFLIGESIFVGLENAVRKMRNIVDKAYLIRNSNNHSENKLCYDDYLIT